MTDWRRLSEKLRAAASAVTESERPTGERLGLAYRDGLSGLVPEDFPDDAGRHEFESVVKALSERDAVFEGEGTVATTTLLMGDADAEALAARIVALEARYREGE